MEEEAWVKDVRSFLKKGPGIIVRLRGLPYECSAHQVVEFFRNGEASSEVKNGESGVYFVKKSDGKSSGDAFVMFETDQEASLAMTKHKECIGTRYIELFRINCSDMEQTVRRTLENKSRPAAARLQTGIAPVRMPPQQGITSGTAKDCIRLRGLPFEAQVQDILDFFGPFAGNINYQGVHMIYNVLGQPTGEVFVQMDSEVSASRAATHCHHAIMMVGKKQRFVDALQCSGEDMAIFLTEVPSITSPVINELTPQFLPLFPPPLLEPRIPAVAHPTSPTGPSAPPGPVFYVFMSNPHDPFYSPPPMPEWVPEYPPRPQHQNLPRLDYFVS